MPIKVSCPCGQNFTAKDSLAGQTLRCPKCSQPLTIPAARAPVAQRQAVPAPPANSMGDLFEEAGIKEHKGPRCPKCAHPLANPNAVICTSCGYHLHTGEQISGAKVYKSGERGHAEATDTLLDRAAKQIETDKVEEKKNQSQGLPAWMYLIALTALTAFVITMFLIPRDRAFTISGYCLIGFSWLMELYYGILILMVAFGESTTCGLLYLFMPLYPLYFLFTRWEKVGGLFLMQMLFTVVMLAGIGMLAMAPMMAKKKDETTYLPTWRVQPAVCAAFEPGRKAVA
ncbi:MAG: hypothetical protein AB7O38_14675 [Pirellulaceae bacterium]